MPDVKRPKNSVALLSVCRLSHVNKFFREIRKLHSGLQKLHIFELDQYAVHLFGVAFDLFFKCSLGFCPGGNIDVSALSLADSSKVLHLWVRFQASQTGPNVAVTG
jgi:hypothetical protein